MVNKIKVTKTTTKGDTTVQETTVVNGMKLARTLERLTEAVGTKEKTIKELVDSIEKRKLEAEKSGIKPSTTAQLLEEIKLEQATLGLARSRIMHAEFLENYERRVKELNRNAYKENILYRGVQAVRNEHNSPFTAGLANIGLGLATGGLINPVIAQALHLDKLVMAPISAMTKKLLGIGHTTSSAIKNEEEAEKVGLLKRIARGVEGLGKNSKNTEKEKEKESGLFENLLKAAMGAVGTAALLSSISGVPDWAKDYLPWAIGGFMLGGVKGLVGAVILKYGWNLFQEKFGDADSVLNTADTVDTAISKFAEDIGVSPSTLKVALTGATAGMYFGGVKGALAGAVLALAGNAFWAAYKAKDELGNQIDEDKVAGSLRLLNQTASDKAAANGASDETIENIKTVEDTIRLGQSAGSTYTTLKLLRHPLKPKGVAPWLTYGAGAIETASVAQQSIDKNGGAFNGLDVAGELVGSVEQSWENTFTDAGTAYDKFSNGEIFSGLYHSGATVKDIVWDDFLMGAAKLGGALGASIIGGGQAAWDFFTKDDEEEEKKQSNAEPFKVDPQLEAVIDKALYPYGKPTYLDPNNFYLNNYGNLIQPEKEDQQTELTRRDMGFMEQSTELLADKLVEKIHDPQSVGIQQVRLQESIRDTLADILKVQTETFEANHNIKTWEQNERENGLTGGITPPGTTDLGGTASPVDNGLG